MMRTVSTLCSAASCLAIAGVACAADESELHAWLDRTMELESGGDHIAVGDGGRSRGAYQIQRATWQRYSRRPWATAAHESAESRRVCRLVLLDCARSCRRAGRPATFANVRYFYRHGGF